MILSVVVFLGGGGKTAMLYFKVQESTKPYDFLPIPTIHYYHIE